VRSASLRAESTATRRSWWTPAARGTHRDEHARGGLDQGDPQTGVADPAELDPGHAGADAVTRTITPASVWVIVTRKSGSAESMVYFALASSMLPSARTITTFAV
jgi:hypothetical protein